MKNQDTLYWLWLAEKCGIASRKFNLIIEKYSDPFDVYRLEESEISQLSGLDDTLRDRLAEKDLDASYEKLTYCKQNGVDIISYGDPRYPARLKELCDPPIVLYCKGHFPDVNTRLCIGVVGTRKMTEYGRRNAYDVSYELGGAGVVTVSGMALGIDGACACGTISAGGVTVAVLGCGIDTVYPKTHTRLAQEIERHGAIITEYPPKEPPHGYNFPKRNRIISGMCQGTLIVEAAVGSGALITANNAIDQGREVFALPGKIGEAGAEGPNELIRRGAYTVMTAKHLMDHYDFLYGDVIDKKALEGAMRRKPDIDKVFAELGLGYATGLVAEEPEVYLAPRGRGGKKKAEAKAPAQNTAAENEQIPLAEVKAAEKAQRTEENTEMRAIVDSLDSLTRRIFDSMPLGKAISADSVVDSGVGVAEAITALTMLELQGLVSSLPGGLYIRK